MDSRKRASEGARDAAVGADADELLSHYLLDGASPLPALSLAPKPGHRVLDLCAAPGGKSLVLAGQLFAAGGSERASSSSAAPQSVLEANDKSGLRRVRLCQVLREYLPAHLLQLSPHSRGVCTRGMIVVRGFDGAIGSGRIKVGGVRGGWGGGLNFDRILVDAPCSSERHFVHAWRGNAIGARGGGGGKKRAGGAGNGWSRGRLKADAKVQYGLVMQALALLSANDGEVVYCTCSIAPEENDAVIEKVLKSGNGRGARFSLELVDPLENLCGSGLDELILGVERTGFGAIMLPDVSRFGPLYWAKIRKTPATKSSGPCAGGWRNDSAEKGEEEEEEEEEEREGEGGWTR